MTLPSLDNPESLIDIHMTEACMGSSWNCQLFRSITSDSAVFNHGTRSKMHMNPKKGRIVDSSITQAYIQAIRNAEHFIYIENQYFMGSSYCWLNDQHVNCFHVIPCEIAQKM